MNKKSQGMSMNIIVVAALALIILVVLVVIFVEKPAQPVIQQIEENISTQLESPAVINPRTVTGNITVNIQEDCVDMGGKIDWYMNGVLIEDTKPEPMVMATYLKLSIADMNYYLESNNPSVKANAEAWLNTRGN